MRRERGGVALVTGGDYAEYVVANQHVTMMLPKKIAITEAAAIAETFMTGPYADKYMLDLERSFLISIQ